MKRISLIATISVLIIAFSKFAQDIWWAVFNQYIGEDNKLIYDKIDVDIPNWYNYMVISNYMGIVENLAFGGLLFFFCKLYKNQNDTMQKSSLLAIIGLCLIIVVMLYYSVSNLFGWGVFQSTAFSLIVSASNIIGYILLLPFFYNLYKKSK